jgi:redox-sensitive bicupin YhaK (pirin superfamily)
MLQIMVRPHALDLEPNIQHGPIAPAAPNTWRHLFGPEGGAAPFFVRNRIDFYDLKVSSGMGIDFPSAPGRDLYFYVFTGSLTAGGRTFGQAEQGMLPGGGTLALRALEAAVIVAFLIDPEATVTRAGTVGDTKRIPPPFLARPAMGLLRARNWLRGSKRAG